MSELYTPASTSLRASMAQAIKDELDRAAPNTLKATVELRNGDDWTAAVAWRMDRTRWALDLGAFAKDDPHDAKPPDYGAFTEFTVRF